MSVKRYRFDSIAAIHEKEREAKAKDEMVDLLKGCIMELADVVFGDESAAAPVATVSTAAATAKKVQTIAAVPAAATDKLVELFAREITRADATITIQDVPAGLRQQVADAIKRRAAEV